MFQNTPCQNSLKGADKLRDARSCLNIMKKILEVINLISLFSDTTDACSVSSVTEPLWRSVNPSKFKHC